MITEIGEQKLAKIVFMLLNDLRIALSIEQSEENEIRLVDASMRIITEYWFLRLEEIVLCIHRCKEGRYGKSYGKLSLENIFDWFNKYDQERTRIIDNGHEELKNSTFSNHDRSPDARLARDIFSQAVDQKVQLRIDAYKKRSEDGF